MTFELNNNESIGAQLKALRKSKGITLEELASKMGTDAPHLSRIESNGSQLKAVRKSKASEDVPTSLVEKSPNQPTLPTIASYLKVFGYKKVLIKI